MDIVLNALTPRAKVLIQGALHAKSSLNVKKAGNRTEAIPVSVLFDENRTTVSFPQEEKLSWRSASASVLGVLDSAKLDIVDISADNVINFCLKENNERLKFARRLLT